MTELDIDRRLAERFAELRPAHHQTEEVAADVSRHLRRRRRRRVGGRVVLLAAAAFAGVGVLVAGDDSGQRVTTEPSTVPSTTETSPVNLITVGWREGPQLSDPVTGSRSQLGPSMGDGWQWCNCPIVRAGDHAFTVQNRRLFSFTPGDGSLRDTGPADLAFPTPDGDELFVVADGVIERRSLDNRVVGGPWTVPEGYHLTEQPHAVSTGFVVSNKSEFIGDLAWWDASTGQIHPLGEYNQFIDAYAGGAAGDDLLAWTTCPTGGFPCSLVLSDLEGTDRRVIAPPVEGNGFYLGGAFSPDGSMLATTVSAHPGTQNPDADLALVDVRSGEARVVAGSRFGVGEPYGYATWSPDGSRVFFTGDAGVRAYEPAADRITDLPFPGTYYSVAAVPSLDRSSQCAGTAHPWQAGPGGPDESGDGLPPAGTATELAADTVAIDELRDSYGATDARVAAEPGRAWTRRADGTVEIVPETIYTVVVELPSAEACPHEPAIWNGVPLTFLVSEQ